MPEAPFDSYKIDYDVSDSEKMAAVASTAYAYILRDDISPLYGDNTDENGYADFHGVAFSEGVYLVACMKQEQGDYIYFAEPYLVFVPYGSTDSVTLNAKFEKIPTESLLGNESRRILKSWIADTGRSRPKQIEVELLCDGEVYDSAVLSKENNWRHEWANLPGGHRWIVTEKNIEGEYTVSITRTEGTILIVNKGSFIEEETTTSQETTLPEETTSPEGTTKPQATTDPKATTKSDTTEKPEDEPELPVTGMLMWSIPYLACLGLLLFIIGFVKDKKEAA